MDPVNHLVRWVYDYMIDYKKHYMLAGHTVDKNSFARQFGGTTPLPARHISELTATPARINLLQKFAAFSLPRSGSERARSIGPWISPNL
jgi:hypothetical protein